MREPNVNYTSEQVNFLHLNSDKDAGSGALHHTLGMRPSQASPGSHVHNGRDSKRVDLSNLTGSSTDFVIVGGTTGTQPTFSGAPMFTGSYTRWGNICHFYINVDMDNITSFGTGQYYLDLPFPAKAPYQFSDGALHHAPTARDYPITGHVAVGASRMLLQSLDAAGNTTYNIAFTSIQPVTLSTADNFHIAGTYEVA